MNSFKKAKLHKIINEDDTDEQFEPRDINYVTNDELVAEVERIYGDKYDVHSDMTIANHRAFFVLVSKKTQHEKYLSVTIEEIELPKGYELVKEK